MSLFFMSLVEVCGFLFFNHIDHFSIVFVVFHVYPIIPLSDLDGIIVEPSCIIPMLG